MDRKKLVLLGVLAAFLGLVLLLVLGNRRPPFLPRDPDHAPSIALDACWACHGPEGPAPRSANHPVARDCLRCHGVR